jgi:hypothetical protein
VKEDPGTVQNAWQNDLALSAERKGGEPSVFIKWWHCQWSLLLFQYKIRKAAKNVFKKLSASSLEIY